MDRAVLDSKTESRARPRSCLERNGMPCTSSQPQSSPIHNNLTPCRRRRSSQSASGLRSWKWATSRASAACETPSSECHSSACMTRGRATVASSCRRARDRAALLAAPMAATRVCHATDGPDAPDHPGSCVRGRSRPLTLTLTASAPCQTPSRRARNACGDMQPAEWFVQNSEEVKVARTHASPFTAYPTTTATTLPPRSTKRLSIASRATFGLCHERG